MFKKLYIEIYLYMQKIQKLLENQIITKSKNKKNIALLFSSGVDSLVIAKILRNKKIPFKAYFVYKQGCLKDLENVEETEEIYGLDVVKIKVQEKQINEVYKKLNEKIKNPVQLSVGITFYFALEKISKEKHDVVFSGYGADEVFLGYARDREVLTPEEHLKKIIENLEQNKAREVILQKMFKLNLVYPYLSKKIIDIAINLKPEQKTTSTQNKITLRKIAKNIGIQEKHAERKKIAAQYGSGISSVLKKYFKENIGVLFSGGKDSFLCFEMLRQTKNIKTLISVDVDNPDSYMFQKINKKLLEKQSEALGIALEIVKSKGEREKEVLDLESSLSRIIKKHKITALASGVIKSEYQRKRIEKICKNLNLKLITPLFGRSEEWVMNELIKRDIEFLIVKISALGLNEIWLGEVISKKNYKAFKKLTKKHRINLAGEGGEYESVVINSFLFKKKIFIKNKKKKMENEFTGVLEFEV